MANKVVDLTGLVFGELAVVSRSEDRCAGQVMWVCRCSCGAQVSKGGGILRSGRAKSCGHLRTKKADTRVGRVFGGLTVISEVSREGDNPVMVRCGCGSENQVSYYKLASAGWAARRSCRASSRVGARRLYPSRSGPTYNSYKGMLARCRNQNLEAFRNYGGRGITVCSDWATSYEAFFNDMGERPDGTSLDRIDNSKGYSKDNCRWASAKVQLNNTRVNVTIDLDGEVKTVAQWAETLKIPAPNIYARLRRDRFSTVEWLKERKNAG